MTSQPCQQTFAMNILNNIGRSQEEPDIKIGQLFEKSNTKCGAETTPRTFSKNSKLSMSLNQ